MGEEFLAVPIVGMLFIGLPWLIFHYVTKWKSAATLTREDENLLDQLHDTARRLDDRLETVERILTADNPNWKSGDLGAPASRINHRN
jgi:phage shock protein B